MMHKDTNCELRKLKKGAKANKLCNGLHSLCHLGTFENCERSQTAFHLEQYGDISNFITTSLTSQKIPDAQIQLQGLKPLLQPLQNYEVDWAYKNQSPTGYQLDLQTAS